jgi:hypothetical protein
LTDAPSLPCALLLNPLADPQAATAAATKSPAKDADGDDDGEEGAEGEHEVDDSKLKLPGVKLADVKVATHEEDEDVVYKQCVGDVLRWGLRFYLVLVRLFACGLVALCRGCREVMTSGGRAG